MRIFENHRFSHRPFISSVLLGSAGALLLGGASATAAGPEVSARLIAPERLAAGAKAPVVVEMKLGTGWHVNSHTPSEPYLIPTTVSLTPSSGSLSEVRYPKAVEKRFEFSEEPLAVYEGTVRFEAELTLSATTVGKAVLKGTLAYQACNDHQCYPPAKLGLEAAVAVTGEHPGGR